MRKTQFTRSLVIATLALSIPFGAALATVGSGVVGTIVGRGTIDARVHGEFPGFDFIVREDIDAVTQSLTIAPGGYTGWHRHPGVAVVTIVSGTLTFFEARDEECRGHEYTVGDTFVDRGRQTHIARNLGTTPVTLTTTYFIPVGAELRTDQPDPGTGC